MTSGMPACAKLRENCPPRAGGARNEFGARAGVKFSKFLPPLPRYSLIITARAGKRARPVLTREALARPPVL